MEINDINKYTDDTILICLNCYRKDIAEVWKKNANKCISCNSRAVKKWNPIFGNEKPDKKKGKKKVKRKNEQS